MLRQSNIPLILKSSLIGLVFSLSTLIYGAEFRLVEEIENLEKRTQEEKLKEAAIASGILSTKNQTGGDDNGNPAPLSFVDRHLQTFSTFDLLSDLGLRPLKFSVSPQFPLYLLYGKLKIPLS